MLSTAANLINKLACEHNLSDAELLTLITSTEPDINKLLACEADKLRLNITATRSISAD